MFTVPQQKNEFNSLCVKTNTAESLILMEKIIVLMTCVHVGCVQVKKNTVHCTLRLADVRYLSLSPLSIQKYLPVVINNLDVEINATDRVVNSRSGCKYQHSEVHEDGID